MLEVTIDETKRQIFIRFLGIRSFYLLCTGTAAAGFGETRRAGCRLNARKNTGFYRIDSE